MPGRDNMGHIRYKFRNVQREHSCVMLVCHSVCVCVRAYVLVCSLLLHLITAWLGLAVTSLASIFDDITKINKALHLFA